MTAGTSTRRAGNKAGSTTYLRQQRLLAWRRDGGRCVWCGKRPHLNRCSPRGCPLCFEADHLVHVSNGGTDHHSNLLTACRACNQARGTHPTPTQGPASMRTNERTNAASEAGNPMAGVRRAW